LHFKNILLKSILIGTHTYSFAFCSKLSQLTGVATTTKKPADTILIIPTSTKKLENEYQ